VHSLKIVVMTACWASSPLWPAYELCKRLKPGFSTRWGKVDLHPGVPSVIPGRVDLSVEIGGLDEARLDEAEAGLSDGFAATAGEYANPESCVTGARVLLHALMGIDALLVPRA
jgi:hypothetical protein